MTNGNDKVYPTSDCSQDTLTKRELFAAMAMQGLLAHDSDRRIAYIADDAVEAADALIAELNKEVQS